MEDVTLTLDELPAHTHRLRASSQLTSVAADPVGDVTGNTGVIPIYSDVEPTTNMSPDAIGATGGARSHTNVAPFLPVNFLIALTGVFPPE